MKLEKIKDKVWISSFEEERDRPAIGYVCGEKHCLAVDAGHSGKTQRSTVTRCLRKSNCRFRILRF